MMNEEGFALLLWFFIWYTLMVIREGQCDDSIEGKHLRIIHVALPPIMNIERNSSGHIIKMSGVAQFALDLLVEKLHFTYSVVQDLARTVSDSPTYGKGAWSFITEGRADLLCSSVVMTSQRANIMDVPYIFLVSPFALMIPMPRPSTDAGGFWKPFQPYVWLAAFISLFILVLCFWFAMRFLSKVKIGNLRGRYNTMHEIYRTPYFMARYTVSMLLSQPGVFNHYGNAIRIGIAAFSLAAFVLNHAYSSVLISFATTPIFRPLIESVYDIPKNPRVRVTVDKDMGTDVFLRESGDGVLKYIGDMLRNETQLRCTDIGGCLGQVKAGSSVYVNRNEIILDLIGRAYKQTSKCDYLVARNKFMTVDTGLFALAKNWPHTRQFTVSLMEMEAAGFFHLWWKRMITDPDRCLNFIAEQKSLLLPLNFDNVSGAFFILAAGVALSFLIFLIEMMCGQIKKPTSN